MAKIKKIHKFHRDMVKKHIDELLEKNETVCNSPFLRMLIYKELQSRGLEYTSVTVDYGKIYHMGPNRSSFDYTANPKRILHHLNMGRYQKNIIYEDCYCEPPNTEELSRLFDDSVSKDTKYDILVRFSNDKLGGKFKSHVFDSPRKNIKKITLVKDA